jgi:AraC family transcriptional regulator
VIEFIEANLGEDLTLTDVASVAHLSTFHFARAFKLSVGQTPHQYISALRLDHAKSLLASSERSVSDISAAVNFSSQAGFTKAFRRAVGVTPGQYRRSVGRPGRQRINLRP